MRPEGSPLGQRPGLKAEETCIFDRLNHVAIARQIHTIDHLLLRLSMVVMNKSIKNNTYDRVVLFFANRDRKIFGKQNH